VQPDAAWHRWWYLLPLAVLGILGLVRRFFNAEKKHEP
jgi:MYXO-CTERM domain-containing protein